MDTQQLPRIQFHPAATAPTIETQVEVNYQTHGDDNTISTSAVPWVLAGKAGVYALYIRKARLFNREPSFGYSVRCGGMTNRDGFSTMQAALDAALEEAQRMHNDFFARNPDCL